MIFGGEIEKGKKLLFTIEQESNWKNGTAFTASSTVPIIFLMRMPHKTPRVLLKFDEKSSYGVFARVDSPYYLSVRGEINRKISYNEFH